MNIITKLNLLFSIVGSYESTNCPSTNWILNDDFPDNKMLINLQ